MGVMTIAKGKTPSESAVETRYLVMPHQANPKGTAFGGAIMSWIDMVAAMAAERHCGTPALGGDWVVASASAEASFSFPAGGGWATWGAGTDDYWLCVWVRIFLIVAASMRFWRNAISSAALKAS